MNNKFNITLSLMLISIVVSSKELVSDFDSSRKLGQLWQDEEIYFNPNDKGDVLLWNGVIFHYSSKKCFELKQKDIAEGISAGEVKCEKNFLVKATEPYISISDFEKFQSRFLACLKNDDRKCLRGLISKTMQLSFGVDGSMDRRDSIFESWKVKDFKRLRELIQKGCVGEGDSRTFPPEVSDHGMGYRGEFKKEDGRWLLKSFLAGD